LSRNNTRQFLQIGALQSILHFVRGEYQQALDCLRTTVLLGEAGGALRYFVDLSPDLIPLLQKLHDLGIATAYIERILNAYNDRVGLIDLQSGKNIGTRTSISPATAALIAEFTNREMDVLLLLNERLTNKEIARKLHISPETVKKYTLKLYRKLDVNGRRQAVARARELGILPVN
jgi:LuxR family maltose regulon positive regulatory protein